MIKTTNHSHSILTQLQTGLTDFECKAQSLLNSNNDYNIFDAIADIKENLLGWVKSGLLLGEIKKEFGHLVLKNKLAKNWAEFCQKFFNQSHWYTDRLINGSRVVMMLIKKGFTILPNCEAQARHLIKFLPQDCYADYEVELVEKELSQTWQAVIKASQNQPITADLVLSIVDPDKSDSGTTNIRLPKKLKAKLQDLALESGFTSVTKYLESLVDSEENTESITTEVEEKWQDDLDELVKEHEQETENKFKGFGTKPTQKKSPKKVVKEKEKETKNNFDFDIKGAIADIIDQTIELIDAPQINFNST